MSATLSLLLSETLVSFYPLLIKTTDVDILTQSMIRVLTFSFVSFFFMEKSLMEILKTPSYYLIGILNLFHIYSSYIGFQRLDIGVSLSIFYLYPIINVLIKESLSGKVNMRVIMVFLQSLLGVYLISRGMESVGNITNITNVKNNMNSYWIGVIAMLLAAVSESLIYSFYKKSNETNPFDMLFILSFFGSFIALVLWLWKNPLMERQNMSPLIAKIVFANLFIGVIGHLLRFYSIPKISTEWFSILTFCEVIIGYLIGWFFLKEKMTKWHLIGTSIIAYSVYQIKSMGFA